MAKDPTYARPDERPPAQHQGGSGSGHVADAGYPLIAYRHSGEGDMRIVPAPAQRAWMPSHPSVPRRCLPLVMANQAGWLLLNSSPLFAVWTGGPDHSDLKVVYTKERPPNSAAASSHFGQGILTWRIPTSSEPLPVITF